ncbi:hypothetical protein HYX14_06060 [Candidatus Woesearchaeota archaeon]|nr:hypothetical protein [Candidatus Woesearchaeota archaeon]
MKFWEGILILFTLLLLLGCGQSPESLAQYNFKQGVAELQLQFLKNAPPEKIFPNSEFKIIIEADNPSGYDIANGQIKIVGLDPKYFQLNPLQQNLDPLKGRSLTIPAGEKQFLEFDGFAGNLLSGMMEYPANYFLKLSYQSTLEFADTICVNPNFYTVYDAGCMVQDRKSYAGQGAPVAVTELQEILLPGSGASVEFRLRLQTRGRGKVNMVSLTSAKLGGDDIPCQFQGALFEPGKMIFTPEKQEAVVVCRQFLPDTRSYTTTLSLAFSYDYELKEQHRLSLVNPDMRSAGFFS